MPRAASLWALHASRPYQTLPQVVGHLQRNGELNELAAPRFTSLRLDWTDLSALQPQQLRSFRLLLVADCLYQSQLVGSLVGTILSLLHPQG